MSIGIYKIENLINHKKYIGQSIEIERRWINHKYLGKNQRDYDCCYYIHSALRKYGIENFDFSIIELCNIDELDEKEKYWINYYNTCVGKENSWGYNLTEGGDTYPNFLKLMIDQYDLDGNFIQTLNSISEAQKMGYASDGNIVNCLKRRNPSAGGYQWRYHGEDAPEKLIYKVTEQHIWSSNKRKVSQFTKNGEYINTFDSAHEAVRNLEGKKNSGHISECCAGKRKSAYGYIWKYAD